MIHEFAMWAQLSIPLAFLLSFAGIFFCGWISDRAVGVAILVFGYGWLSAIVWWGLIEPN
jgi:hypothetical protein